MGRRADIHYVTILRQFKCWKHFPRLMRVKAQISFCGYTAATTLTPPPPAVFGMNHLLANALVFLGSSQYAIIFSQSLTRSIFFTSGIDPN